MRNVARRVLPGVVIAVLVLMGALLAGLPSVGQSPPEDPVGEAESAANNGRGPANSSGQPPWLTLITLAGTSGILGGLFGELWREVLAWVRRRSESKQEAKEIVHTHLEPILKSADELLGKLRALAQEGFRDFRQLPAEANKDLSSFVDLGSVLYLFATLWARLEILRKESVYVNLNRDKQGQQLMQFLRCLESKRVRIVDRAWQRAIGESLVYREVENRDCIPFREFVTRYLEDEKYRGWFRPLRTIIGQVRHTRYRQKLLLYGAVVHALYDTLDPDHMTTRVRPGYANKLTSRTRRALRYRVFRVYLPFVEKPAKYIDVQDQKA